MSKNIKLAIVGVTGAVGREAVAILERRNFPLGELTLFAGPERGRRMKFCNDKLPVMPFSREALRGVDVAIFSVGSGFSREHAVTVRDNGCVVIDNSSAFRMDPLVPLIVPPINASDLGRHRGLIANPNCTTAIALMALAPLHRIYQLVSITGATYQAASGAGAEAMDELRRQSWVVLQNKRPKAKVLPQPIAFNLFPQVGSFLGNGYTDEEMKMVHESRKILNHPTLLASITCVRVPVMRAHSLDVTAEFAQPLKPQLARDVLKKAPGIDVVDDLVAGKYPMPYTASGKLNCEVGRIREDLVNPNAIKMFICGDQLLRGAALNALEIAELVAKTM